MFRRLALASLGCALPLVAQEQSRDTARVAPVVVSATRTPLAQSALPVAVTVITAQELQARGITTVSDALADVSSAYVAQSGGQGSVTSLFLRGGESKYVKVLIDGVAANDPGGAFDFASLTTDNIERIEIVRGPASVIHGADAVTGVVHIITRRGTGSARVEAEVRSGTGQRGRLTSGAANAGSTQNWDASAALSGALASGAYSLSLARHYSTGAYELNNRYQNNVLSGRYVFTPLEGTDVRLALRYNDYQYNYPTDGGGNAADSNAYRTEDRTVIGVEVERKLSPSVRSVLSLNSSVNEGGTDDGPDFLTDGSFISQDKVRRRGAELRFHILRRATSTFTFGTQIEQQDQRSQSQSQSSFGPFNSVFHAARRNAGLYSEVMLTPTNRFTATFGARFDHNERFGDFGTGRAGFSWRVLRDTRLRATAGTAFREPSFFENYATGLGNPELQPEHSRAADLAVEQTLLGGRAVVTLTGFAQRFRDIIDYTGSTAACGFSYCNVAGAKANGLELEANGRVAGPLWATAGLTLLKTRVTEPGFDQSSGGLYHRDEALIRRPERKATADLAYRGEGPFSAVLRVIAVGVRTDRDFNTYTPVTLPSYERFDLSAQYALPAMSTTRSALTFRAENLTDEVYQNIFNFLAPRRTLSMGIRSSF